MIDIQSSKDTREIPLQKVGVTDLSYPVQVLDKAEGSQKTCAKVNLFVNLPHNYKNSHVALYRNFPPPQGKSWNEAVSFHA